MKTEYKAPEINVRVFPEEITANTTAVSWAVQVLTDYSASSYNETKLQGILVMK